MEETLKKEIESIITKTNFRFGVSRVDLFEEHADWKKVSK